MMLDKNFKVLNSVACELRKCGIEVSIEKETICIGRGQWDKFSKRTLAMLSAAPKIIQGEKSFQIFASEQYGNEGATVKYSIKICDGHGREIKAWELDTKRGKHIHLYLAGKKDHTHHPFRGSFKDIVDEIMSVMRGYDPKTQRVN